MNTNPVRTAIVSFGISSKTFHAPFLTTNPDFKLISVVERKGRESEKLYPWVQVVNSFEQLLENPEVELVVITSPNETHFPYAKAAMLAGKHVVVEKPFTTNSAEALELVDISANTGKLCSVYHNRRYVSDFRTMREILNKQLLGELHEFVAHYDRYRPDPRTIGVWREKAVPGSGVFYDLGSHLLDQSLVLFGHPQHIYADIRRQKPYSQVDDYFDIDLDYGFLKVTIHSGMLIREMGPRYMMHGTLGSFVKYGEDPQEEKLKAGQLPVGEDWCYESEEQYGILHTLIDGEVVRRKYPSLRGDFGDYYRNLYQAIRNEAQLSEKPEQAHNVIRLIELAFESSESKKQVAVTGLL